MAVPTTDLKWVAKHSQVPVLKVEQTVELLDAGNTVQFIARYRKDKTEGLNEAEILCVQSALRTFRQLAERKRTIIRCITGQGGMTDELARHIETIEDFQQLADVYLPYQPNKYAPAVEARKRNLTPLAEAILAAKPMDSSLEKQVQGFVNLDAGLSNPADVLAGVRAILAERWSEHPEMLKEVRKLFWKIGRLVVRVTSAKEGKSCRYQRYHNFNKQLTKVPPYTVLLLTQGVCSGALQLHIDVDMAAIEKEALALLIPKDHPHAELLGDAVCEVLKELVIPRMDRETRTELNSKVSAYVEDVSTRDLRSLLLQPPMNGRRILAIDLGCKDGYGLAALDEEGAVLEQVVFPPVRDKEFQKEFREKLSSMAAQHGLSLIVVGNGPARRMIEKLLTEMILQELAEREVYYIVVSRLGVDEYATSVLAREEFPQLGPSGRCVVSIGRRVQDPLRELVKSDPTTITVRFPCREVKLTRLRKSLEAAVCSCVSFTGVDLNAASAAQLRHTSGLNPLSARNIIDYRVAHGPFETLEQLRQVRGMDDFTFRQAAGFLIVQGANPLDALRIHPENYKFAEKLLLHLGLQRDRWKDSMARERLVDQACQLDRKRLAVEWGVGESLFDDMLAALFRPNEDVRKRSPMPLLRKAMLEFKNLQEGMELSGCVLSVVDFGAFVDLGLPEAGLLHISQMASQFVRDPREIVAVGQVVKVWVARIDRDHHRVSLTMVQGAAHVDHKPPEKKRQCSGQLLPGEDVGNAHGDGRGVQKRLKKPKKGGSLNRGDRSKVKRPPRVPITKAMEDGREPMRSFGDLWQYHRKKKEQDDSGQS